MKNQKKRPHPKFTLELKQSAVKSVTEKGQAHQQAADSLGLSLTATGRWLGQEEAQQAHLPQRRQP